MANVGFLHADQLRRTAMSRQSPRRRCSPQKQSPTKQKARHKGGLVVRRCRLLLAPACCGETGEAESEKGKGAGFGDGSNVEGNLSD